MSPSVALGIAVDLIAGSQAVLVVISLIDPYYSCCEYLVQGL
jgi:hypothetical protein